MNIVKFLGMGNEGVVFVKEEDGQKKIVKFFRFPIENKKDVINCLNVASVNGVFKIECIDNQIMTYDHIDLLPMENTTENFRKILNIALELYDKTGMIYFDLDIQRDNFMADKNGKVFIVDYINGFTKVNKKNELICKLNIINSLFFLIDKKNSINQGIINKGTENKLFAFYCLFISLKNMLKNRINPLIIFHDLPYIIGCILEKLCRKKTA